MSSQPRDREIHIIADNLSAHKTAKVLAFLDAHPNVDLHCTPTYASWLNQVELCFARVKPGLRLALQEVDETLWVRHAL